MKLLFNYLTQYKKFVFLVLGLTAVNQIFSMLDPFIFRYIIDNYATKFAEYSTAEFLQGVIGLAALAVLAALVSRIAKNFQDYYLNVITQRLGAQMYADGVRHTLALPFAEFEDARSGETLGVLQKARADVERLISLFVNNLFMTLVGIVFVTFYAFSVHWLVAPIYLLMIPLIAGVSLFMSRRIKAVQKSVVAETTALAGSTTESLRNIELVRSLGLSEQEISRLNSTTEKILGLELKKVKYVRRLSFIQGTIVNTIRTGLMIFMMYLIFTQQITVGQFFTLFIYSFFIFGPMQDLGNLINIYRETEVSLDNFKHLLEKETERTPAAPAEVGEIQSLSFAGVSFKHRTAKEPAVKEVSFEAKAGETVAFAGPSGSGKTTIVKLLVGLYEPAGGRVLYNGIDFATLDRQRVREKIGFVTQDTQLFSGTIRDNLKFVNPSATDSECLKVLQEAQCENLLARGGEGLDTRVGEGGMKLSGGERQRLSIARALLRKPAVLVFDEATSALDSLTEEEIGKTVRKISASGKHITVMIAHRLSTIMHADRIYVLEKGEIVEAGSHEKLLKKKGLYYAMWREQIGERE
jgi:ATP-binding cassette subfamily B protein